MEPTAPQAADQKEGVSSNDAFSSFTLDDLKTQFLQNATGDFILTIPELLYTASDTIVQSVLQDQSVECVGQVIAEPGSEKRLRIFRLLIECCTGDKRPLAISIEFADGVPQYNEMSWHKVTGKMAYPEEGGLTVPVLRVESFAPTEKHEEAIMY